MQNRYVHIDLLYIKSVYLIFFMNKIKYTDFTIAMPTRRIGAKPWECGEGLVSFLLAGTANVCVYIKMVLRVLT